MKISRAFGKAHANDIHGAFGSIRKLNAIGISRIGRFVHFIRVGAASETWAVYRIDIIKNV